MCGGFCVEISDNDGFFVILVVVFGECYIVLFFLVELQF